MDIKQINDSLSRLFFEENRQVVLWYDAEQNFEAEFEALGLEDIIKWRIDQNGELATKLEIELNRPNSKFLLYSSTQKPSPKDNWLQDILMYSEEFRADKASIIHNNLKLITISLIDHINKNMEFFKSKEREEKLAKLIQPSDSEREIDLKILSVLSKANYPSIESILLSILEAYTSEKKGCLDKSENSDLKNNLWKEVQKYNMEEPFWNFVFEHFDYKCNNSTLKDFFISLLISHMKQKTGHSKFPDVLNKFTISTPRGLLNSSVFISNWMSNMKACHSYAELASVIESELSITEDLQKMELSQLSDIDTFESSEQILILQIKNLLIEGSFSDNDNLHAVIKHRKDKFWANYNKNYAHLYNALEAAYMILSRKKLYDEKIETFCFASSTDMFNSYTSSIKDFDTYYRHFYIALKKVKYGAEILHDELKDRIEDLYCNWYLSELSLSWNKYVETKLPASWYLENIKRQDEFYDSFVTNILQEKDTTKAYVIISDALRFEVAAELAEKINKGQLRECKVNTMLGLVPSYTQLGMASLLPHNTLSICNNGKVLVDGMDSSSQNRESILQKYFPESGALKLEELLNMSREQGREYIKGKRVIYIYHNKIDAVGDDQATEGDVFSAVETAMTEIDDAIAFIHNGLLGSRILVTADHGFLYQTTPMESSDKGVFTEGGTIIDKKKKKRYVIGSNLSKQEYAWKFRADQIISGENSVDIVIPKGNNRFHFVGGSRFVHGGAMLQEIVIPVLEIKGLRGKRAQTVGQQKDVGVELLSSNTKVSNSRQKFKFLQTGIVGGKIRPLELKIAFYDEESKLISDEQTLTFDSKTDNMSSLQKDLLFSFKNKKYDKSKNYYMIMTNTNTGKEYKRIPFYINIGIVDEFGFF